MTLALARSLAEWCAGNDPQFMPLGIDQARLLELLEVQRVGPWLHHRACAEKCMGLGPLVPLLRQSAARSSAQAMLDAVVRKEVLSAMLNEGLHPIPLKGTVLGPWLYGDAALRPNHDMDILLAPGEVSLGALVLRKLGFRAVHRTHTPWLDGMSHERAFWRNDDLPIELHRHITQMHRFRVPVGELLERAVPWDYGGMRVRRLALEDQFLHMVIHAAHHKFLIPMVHWLDMKLLLDRGLDFDEVLRRGRRYQMAAALAIVAERLKAWFSDERLMLRVARLSGARRVFLRGLLQPGLAARATHGSADVWYAFWLTERNRDRGLFALEYAIRWALDRPHVRQAQKSRQLRSSSKWRSWGLKRLQGFSVLSSGRMGSPHASQ